MSLPRSTILLFSLVSLTIASPGARADTLRPSDGEPTRWGLGAKVRRWYFAEPLQRLFFEDGPGAAMNTGPASTSASARETSSWPLASEPTGTVDYVTFDNLHVFTAEVTAISHYRMHRLLEFRLGAGLGVGMVRGEMRKTDALCTGAELQTECMIAPAAMEVNQPYDLPPVLPVVNLFVGLQLVPFDFLHIHLDAGVHSVPFVGAGATFYLW